MATVQKANTCPMCESSNRSQVIVKSDSGKKESVPVCMQCAHYDFPNTEYAYVIRGIGERWASSEDLRATLENILKENLPPEDVKNMIVEVAELA